MSRYEEKAISLDMEISRQALGTLSEENIGYLRANLVQGGCNVVVAPMEADVYIAKQGGTVVSRDSDFFIHLSIEKIVKFNMNTYTRNIKLLCFERSSILEKLKLTSNCLLALGIVSGNDYSCNIPGLEIARNFKFLSSCNFKSSDSLEKILFVYQLQFKNQKTQYIQAKSIFWKHHEDVAAGELFDQYSVDSQALVSKYHSILGNLDKLKDELQIRQGAARNNDELSHLDIWNKYGEFKKRNQFAPVHQKTSRSRFQFWLLLQESQWNGKTW